MLTRVAEENHQRDAELRPGRVSLQCLRCRSEFTLRGEGGEDEEAAGRARRRGVDERDEEEPTPYDDDGKGERIKTVSVDLGRMLKAPLKFKVNMRRETKQQNKHLKLKNSLLK